MSYTRREFAKLALASLPAAGLLTRLTPSRAAEVATGKSHAKPNSKVNGVQIGLNVPYSFGNNAMGADDVLAGCLNLGVNALEMRTQPVESFLGAPVVLVRPRGAVVVPAEAEAEAEKL